MKASIVKVVDWKEIVTIVIYVVSKYCEPKKLWRVSYYTLTKESRCSCEHMESFRILCVHVISVMVYLDIDKLLSCLILDKCTMKVKEAFAMRCVEGVRDGDSCYKSRVLAMNEKFRELTNVACLKLDDFNEIMD